MVNRILRNDLGYNLGDYYDGGFYEGESTFKKVNTNHLKYVKTSNHNPYIYDDLVNTADPFADWFSMKIDMMMKEYPSKKISKPYFEPTSKLMGFFPLVLVVSFNKGENNKE